MESIRKYRLFLLKDIVIVLFLLLFFLLWCYDYIYKVYFY